MKIKQISIGCMPSLALLTTNALACADKVIIPVQSEFLAAKGMSHLMTSILQVRKYINPNLKVGGILLTMVDGRTNLSKDISKELKEKINFLIEKGDYPTNLWQELYCQQKTKNSILLYNLYTKIFFLCIIK